MQGQGWIQAREKQGVEGSREAETGWIQRREDWETGTVETGQRRVEARRQLRHLGTRAETGRERIQGAVALAKTQSCVNHSLTMYIRQLLEAASDCRCVTHPVEPWPDFAASQCKTRREPGVHSTTRSMRENPLATGLCPGLEAHWGNEALCLTVSNPGPTVGHVHSPDDHAQRLVQFAAHCQSANVMRLGRFVLSVGNGRTKHL